MKRLVKTYLMPYMGQVLLAVIFMAIAAAMTASLAQLMKPVLDDVLSGKDRGAIIPIGFLVLGTFIVRGVTTYLHTIIMNKVGQSIVADIQKDLFNRFMGLDLAFFHANPSGQLISRVISDVNVMRVAVSDGMTGLGKSLLTLLFLVAVMLNQDLTLSLVAFTIFPFALGFIAYIGRRLRKVSKNIQHEMALFAGQLSQIFLGMRQVIAYGMQDHETRRTGNVIETVKRLNIKANRIGNMSTPVNEILVGFVAAGIIIYGGYQVADGGMTAGQLVAFLAAFTLAYEPAKKLAKMNNNVQTGLGAAERVFDMIDLQASITDRPGARSLNTKSPTVEFKNVEFRYEGSDVRALNGVSFEAKPGKVTALVGPSGGGKTTIINLIPRLYDAMAGGITIDGENVQDVTLESLRQNIALVSQDITIFDDTIAANIAYGRIGATQEEIETAANLAAADKFIREFPDGYQTQTGESGVKLSGGQRQRIAIARAILRDSPILLLDEATSSLDNESEKLIHEAMKELEKGRTTIVIAHRLSTVQDADQIIVLDKGLVVEEGTHDSLIDRKGLYEKMYRAGFNE